MVFTLSQAQFAAFEENAPAQWCVTAARNLHSTFSQHYTAMGCTPDDLVSFVGTIAEWAQRHGIHSRADVTRLSHVAAALGHRFWQDPRFQSYVTTSISPEVPPGRRAMAMTGETKNWLRGFWAGDSLQAFSGRLAELVDAGHGPEARNLRYLLPGQWRMFSAADNDRLLLWLADLAPKALRDAGPRQLAYTACALVHGPQWLSDPQYQRLAEAVRSEVDLVGLGAQITDIYTEATA